MSSHLPHTPSRRGLITGGAAALAGAVAVHGAGRAAAAGSSPVASGPVGHASQGAQLGSPITSTISSPAISGYTYRYASTFDFTPESWSSGRRWSVDGVYTDLVPGTLWASVELPAGALVRDIEWYVANRGGAAVTGLGRIWSASTATLFTTLVDTTINPSGSGLVAQRAVVPSTAYGPHPLGTRISLGIATPTTADVTVNGVRVGFTEGAGATGLLPAPVRVYDSRVSGGKIAAGTVRTITLPSDVVPAGTAGIIANITAVAPQGDGHMTVYAGDAAQPSASTLNYTSGNPVANMATVGVSSSRQIKVFSYRTAHVVVDVTGTVG